MAVSMETRPMIPEHVFREYDIRGVAGKEIDERFAFLLGRAFARRILKLGRNTAVVGHDNRASSPRLHEGVMAGILSMDCRVKDIGQVTTPMFYYSLEALGVVDGIMVTASHNPPDENGFKIAIDKGTIYGDAVRSLQQEMAADDVEVERFLAAEKVNQSTSARGSAMSRTRDSARDEVAIKPLYLTMLGEKIKLGSRRLKVVVDCGNGTASVIAPDALKQWGCEVVPLYCTSDPTFPNHHPDPVEPKNLQDLIETVRREGADLGIAFDGDGDRLGVVDETGQIRWGDQLMVLYWREILPKYPGSEALVEVKCSQALVDEIRKLGGQPRFHRTGHSHIKATLRASNLPFTGEMSGHLFFNDEYYGFDDALYAAGRLLRILSSQPKPLSALFADVKTYYATPETRVPCDESRKQAVIEAVKSHFQKFYPVVTVDGARVEFPDGWALVRSSNTQPILVLRAEATTRLALHTIQAEVERVLQHSGLLAEIPW